MKNPERIRKDRGWEFKKMKKIIIITCGTANIKYNILRLRKIALNNSLIKSVIISVHPV